MALRTSKEKLVDCLLLLHQIGDASNYTHFLSETKLQKLVFLSEKSMLDKREKGFNYNYIKLIHGTYSSELRLDLTKIVQLGLVEDRWLQPTPLALMILEDFKDLFKKNNVFVKRIDTVNEHYAKMPLKQLLELVYDMPHPYLKPPRRIEDLALRTPILYRISQEKAARSFQISDDEAEDLEMCLNPKIVDSMRRAMSDIRAKRLKSHEEIFGV